MIKGALVRFGRHARRYLDASYSIDGLNIGTTLDEKFNDW